MSVFKLRVSVILVLALATLVRLRASAVLGLGGARAGALEVPGAGRVSPFGDICSGYRGCLCPRLSRGESVTGLGLPSYHSLPRGYLASTAVCALTCAAKLYWWRSVAEHFKAHVY